MILDLESNLPEGMLRGAAATTVLRKELERLSGQSVITSRASANMSRDVDRVSDSARKADASINQLTGRLRLFADVAAILGPSLAPVGGVLIAGVGGLANQMGFAAVAGGVLIGSLQGVGDALGAMNDAANDPSDSNLEKAEEALKRLTPVAREFAEAAFDLKPALLAIRDIGAESLIPGLTESLDNLERLGPRVGGIFEAIGGALGDIAADSSASLASERWAGFFDFIQREGPTVLSELATTVGDLTHGLAELWQAFTPLNNDFSSWLMGVADGFDSWATGLSATEGFTEFIDYIRETGPQVADTFGALAGAVVQIAQAAAPLGGPVLAGVEAFANAISAIADSDLGTPIMAGVAALALLNRTMAVTAALSKTSMSSGLFGGLGTASKGIKGQAGSIKSDIAAMSDSLVAFGSNADKAGAAADRMKQRLATGAGLAGLAVAATGAADGIGLTNTASLALMGSFAGPVGVAVGAGVGAFLDLKAAGEGATAAIDGLAAAAQSGDIGVLTAQVEAAKEELADLEQMHRGGGGFDGVLDRLKFGASNGGDLDEVREKYEEGQKALEALTQAQKVQETQSRASAVAYASQAGVWMSSAEWARKSTDEIKAQADALVKAREAADKTARSFVNLGGSLNDSEVSLGGWIKEMASSADALRNFMNNARTAAKRGLEDGLIASLQEAGTEGARRMRQLANATDEEIERANRAWRKGQKAMEDYVNFKVPPKRINVDTSPAMRDIDGLEARLRAIRDENVNVVVRTINTGDTQLGPRNRAADGTTVPKTGRPYADRHLYLLADGEEVISNRYGQADRYRPLLKSINANRRLAEGGTAGDDDKRRRKITRGVAFYADDNTKELQRAIDRLTSVSEDQTKAVEAASSKAEFWAGKMSEVAQATVAGFNSGLFDKSSDPWAAGSGSGPLFNLNKDIAGLRERAGLQEQLAGLGLTGDALGALLAQGTNADIAGMIRRGEIGQYASDYQTRAALQGSVGGAAGQFTFGAEFAAQSKELQAATAAQRATAQAVQRMENELARTQAAIQRMSESGPERTGAAVGRALDGAASDGRRDGKNRTGVRRG